MSLGRRAITLGWRVFLTAWLCRGVTVAVRPYEMRWGDRVAHMIKLDPEESARARFAYELRRHRLAAGLTQAQLGRRIGFSGSLVGAVETLRRAATEEFAELSDRAFGLDGVLVELQREAWPPPPAVPEHYRDWTVEERRATAIKMWDPLLIPGIFQTERYARRVFECAPGIDSRQVEERVVGRMQRKSIFTQENPPVVVSLIDEGVLHRPIGGPGILREQLVHLTEMARHPRVRLQIVPAGAEAIPGLLGAFGIAELKGSPYVAYVECAPRGRMVNDKEVMEALARRYDDIRAHACPLSQSRAILKEAVDKWT